MISFGKSYAQWQAAYEEHGITTLPMDRNKKPRVKNFLTLGREGSRALAQKFPDAEAIAIVCENNGLTILDVDSSDDSVFADALSKFGDTPIKVRSGGGNYQAWFANSGEARLIKPNDALPIDILGKGLVIAPPSVGSSGRYEFIEGSLDDLCRLPRLRPVGGPSPAALIPSCAPGRIPKGRRSVEVWRFCMREVAGGSTYEELLEAARVFNGTALEEPISEANLIRATMSAMQKEASGENWFGSGRRLAIDIDNFDSLLRYPHASHLYLYLKRYNWGHPFVLANAVAPALGYTLSRFRAARDVIVDLGLIHSIHKGGDGRHDPPVFDWGKGG